MKSTRRGILVLLPLLCLIVSLLPGRATAADSKRLGYHRLALVARVEAIDKTTQIGKARVALADPETKLRPDHPMEFELARLPRETAPGDLLTCFLSKYDGLAWVRSPVGDEAACADLLKLNEPNEAQEILRKNLDHLGQETVRGDLVFLRLRQLTLREVFDLKAEAFFESACRRVLEDHSPEFTKIYFFLIAGCGDKGKGFLTGTPALFEFATYKLTAFRSARIAVVGQQEITSIVDSVLAPRSQIQDPYSHYLAIRDHIALGFVQRDVVLSEIARFTTNEELSDIAMGCLRKEKYWVACDRIVQYMKSTTRTPMVQRAAIRFLRAMREANGGELPDEKALLAQATQELEEMKQRFPKSYDAVIETEQDFKELERGSEGRSQ